MTIPTPNLATWRAVIVAFTAIVTGGTALWVSLRPSRPASRLGMRGLKRQRALLNPNWAAIEPLVRWTGVRVSGILSDKARNNLDLQLTHAGDYLGLTVDEYFGLHLLTGILGLFVGLGVRVYDDHYPLAVVPLCIIMGAGVPNLIVMGERARRYLEMNRGLPFAIDLMSLSMSAGLDFPGSIAQVVRRAKANVALRDELGYMLQQFHLGRTRAQALQEFADRVPIEPVKEFVNALLQAEQRGTPVAAVLEIQATTARIRRSNQAENKVEDMKLQMLIPAGIMMAVGFFIIAVPTDMMMEKLMESMTGGVT